MKSKTKNMLLISSIALLGLAGCSPGQIHANHNGGGYVYVGCHVIHTTPQDCYPAPDKCAYAFSPFGDLEVGDTLYFKQVDAYGEVGRVITARPCKEGE